MKAKDWKFDRQIPDAEDIEAKIKACEAYLELADRCNLGDLHKSDYFNAGFMRGLNWAINKFGVQVSAAVELHNWKVSGEL